MFKVGDVVRCKNIDMNLHAFDAGYLEPDNKYVVVDLWSREPRHGVYYPVEGQAIYIVDSRGDVTSHYAWRFELVE